MFQIFILLISVSILVGINVSFYEQCKCSIFLSESTCEDKEQCIWDDIKCVQKTCEYFVSPSKCNQQPVCSWNKSYCSEFTNCQDYYVDDSYGCYLIGDDLQQIECQPDISQNRCTPIKYNQCGLIEEDCSGFSGFWNMCYWNSKNNTCLTVDIRICSNFVDKFLCDLFDVIGCKWSNETCQPKQCEDFTEEEVCVMIRPDNISQDPLLCAWNSETNKCILAEDISHLNYSNCYKNTLNNYIWNTTLNQCVQCASNSITP